MRCTDKNGKGNEISKWKNGKIMVKWTEVKDEKSRWGNDRKINIEIANSASAMAYTLFRHPIRILYGLDVEIIQR